MFLFYWARVNQDLHSFPTRRSSDLASSEEVAGRGKGRCQRVELALTTARSEEHTSELQSRGHLVCRLLLEKKNTLSMLSTSNRKTISTTSRAANNRCGGSRS